MFQNSGRKITVVARVLFWLNLVLALAAAGVAVCFVYNRYGAEMAVMAGLAAAVAVVCYMLVIYVGVLLLHGFGDLVQSNVELRRILADNRRAPERPAYVPPTAPRSERAPAPEPPAEDWSDLDAQEPPRPVNVPAPPAPPAPPKSAAPQPPRPAAYGMVYCRRCGAKHEPGVARCRYCGTPLY